MVPLPTLFPNLLFWKSLLSPKVCHRHSLSTGVVKSTQNLLHRREKVSNKSLWTGFTRSVAFSRGLDEARRSRSSISFVVGMSVCHRHQHGSGLGSVWCPQDGCVPPQNEHYWSGITTVPGSSRRTTQLWCISLFSFFIDKHHVGSWGDASLSLSWGLFCIRSCPQLIFPLPQWGSGVYLTFLVGEECWLWGFFGQTVPGCIKNSCPAWLCCLMKQQWLPCFSGCSAAQHGDNKKIALRQIKRRGGLCLFAVPSHLQAESIPMCHLRHILTGCFCLSSVSWNQKSSGLLGPEPVTKWKPQILLWEETVLEEKEHWWTTEWQNIVRYGILPWQRQAAQSLDTQGASQALSRQLAFMG